MAKTIYLISDCDEWQSHSSMQPIMLSSEQNLKKNMQTIKLHKGYTKDDMETYIHTEKMIIDKNPYEDEPVTYDKETKNNLFMETANRIFDKNENGRYIYTIPTDINEIDSKSLANITENANYITFEDGTVSNEAYEEYMQDITEETSTDIVYNELLPQFRKNLPEAITNEDIIDMIYENIEFVTDSSAEDIKLKTCLILDTGDANYDFGCNNALNYANPDGNLEEPSSLLWLSKQFGKDTELQNAIKNYIDNDEPKDIFIKSVIEELINNSSSNSCIVFLVTTTLPDFLKIKKNIKEHNNGSITLDKNTMCGLYDYTVGGGSTLDITLPDDIKIPYDKIFDICTSEHNPYGYSVQSVYAFSNECYDTFIKKIN